MPVEGQFRKHVKIVKSRKLVTILRWQSDIKIGEYMAIFQAALKKSFYLYFNCVDILSEYYQCLHVYILLVFLPTCHFLSLNAFFVGLQATSDKDRLEPLVKQYMQEAIHQHRTSEGITVACTMLLSNKKE